MGSVFLSQDKDPYDKPSKAKVATEHLENAFVKGAVSNEAPGTSTRTVDHAVKQKLPEDYEKACTQLLAANSRHWRPLVKLNLMGETGENRPCWVWCGTLSSNVERQT